MYGSPASQQPGPSLTDRSTMDAATAATTAERATDRAGDVRRYGVSDGCGARAIAMRIRSLIAHQDAGDVCAAARRLGVPVRQLVQLDTTLVPDADCADARAAVESLLSAVVLRYHASAAWLLTGRSNPDPSAVPPEIAEQLTGLCVAVARRVIEEYQASCLAGAPLAAAERVAELPIQREPGAR